MTDAIRASKDASTLTTNSESGEFLDYNSPSRHARGVTVPLFTPYIDHDTTCLQEMGGLDDLVVELGLEEDVKLATRELGSAIYGSHTVLPLSALRMRAGMSQAELAAALGTSQSRVSLIERGKQDPSFEFACRLSDAIGATLDELRAARAVICE